MDYAPWIIVAAGIAVIVMSIRSKSKPLQETKPLDQTDGPVFDEKGNYNPGGGFSQADIDAAND